MSEKEELKCTSSMSKVDEFGRLVREDHSDSDIDSAGSPRISRRRSKRGRSRSWSRSPVRGRSRSWSPSPIRGRSHSRSRSPRDTRRSPWRRRGRHSRSRSFSPKRRRTRSKSPSYRRDRGDEIGNQKMRRHKAQLPECRDYIRGKCNRGASCRYVHHQSDKTSDRLGSSHMNQSSPDVLPISKSSDVSADTDPITPKRSVHKHKESYESQNFKHEVLFTEKTRGVFEELSDGPRKPPFTETPIGAPVHLDTDTKVPPDISNWQTQVLDGKTAAETSLQTPTPLQSQHPSSRPYLNKDSLSTSYGYPMSTEHQCPSESTMPKSHLPELSPSVGNLSSDLSVGNSTTYSNQIPRDYNPILQHSQFPPPSTTTTTTSWNSLPPPPPLPFPFPNNSVGNTASGLPSAQFQQNSFPPCSDLRYQAPAGAGQLGVYPQMPEPQKSLYDANRFGPRIMPVVSNPMDQVHGTSSHSHPYLNHSPYGLHSVPDGVPTHYGEPGKAVATLSNYSSASQFPPLASTLNNTLTSKSSSIIGTQADQYDPLFDSIEPSSSSVKKPDIGQKLPTCDSDGVLRTSGSNQLLDVDENTKVKGSGGAEGSLILESDLNDETADAEVGVVEDGSGSNPHTADMSTEDDEINQVKASEKTKKGKDSKSMKFFKIAIADFVKEVLKPSWRQGNMSKEAFKTIVKKTVDKVSGTTRKRHIPKSREKIDQFITSQQRKLIKLVMGYVDKYVKA